MIRAYVDGACSNNGKINSTAGWAFVLLDDDENIICEGSGKIEKGTNNIGELTAIKEAILAYNRINTSDSLTIFSDSSYCINGITNWRHNWKRYGWWRDRAKTQILKNKEIWIELDKMIDTMYMFFEKVKGHSSKNNTHSKWNNYVDRKAVEKTK